jgi:hypothetical protein
MIVGTASSSWIDPKLTVVFLEDNGVMPVDHLDGAHGERMWQNSSK